MVLQKDEYFQQLSNAVLEMDEDKTASIAAEIVKLGFDAFEAIE